MGVTIYFIIIIPMTQHEIDLLKIKTDHLNLNWSDALYEEKVVTTVEGQMHHMDAEKTANAAVAEAIAEAEAEAATTASDAVSH